MSAGTVLSGSLQDFGLVEVLQVVELGGMTGAIHLKQANGHMGILYLTKANWPTAPSLIRALSRSAIYCNS